MQFDPRSVPLLILFPIALMASAAWGGTPVVGFWDSEDFTTFDDESSRIRSNSLPAKRVSDVSMKSMDYRPERSLLKKLAAGSQHCLRQLIDYATQITTHSPYNIRGHEVGVAGSRGLGLTASQFGFSM